MDDPHETVAVTSLRPGDSMRLPGHYAWRTVTSLSFAVDVTDVATVDGAHLAPRWDRYANERQIERLIGKGED